MKCTYRTLTTSALGIFSCLLIKLPVPPLQGLVKLADFGVASRLGEIADEEDPAAIAVVGTPYWMAPEVHVPSLNLHGVQGRVSAAPAVLRVGQL